jgi:imidazolonepropionase-like amidohydrolase
MPAVTRTLWFAGAALVASCSPRACITPTEGHFAIEGARVFDGSEVLPHATVLVHGGEIVAVGPDVDIPWDASIVDGAGKTLLPGLIDAHVHHTGFDGALEQALAFGVTTELGMMGDPVFARAKRAEDPSRASLRSAGWALTVPGGLGTTDGPVPTLEPDGDVSAFVAARIAEGSEFLEIMYDHGTGWGVSAPTLTTAQLEGAIKAAHENKILTVVDIATHEETADAIGFGADGLAHLYTEGPDPDLATRIAKSGSFVVATLPILFSICDGSRGLALAAEANVAPYLWPSTDRALRQSYHLLNPGIACSQLLGATKELLEKGVPLLAGTDSGSPGTTHGIGVHDGIALLVEAGMTPVQALAAATSVTAKSFRLERIGRIAKGHRADLLLVNGDPTADPKALRDIAAIWKGGVRFDRDAYRAKVAAAKTKDAVAPIELGSIGSFDGEDTDGWRDRSDRIGAGHSDAELELIAGGAQASNGALRVSIEIATGERGPAWAGAMRIFAAEPEDPTDLGPAKEIAFAAKGDGGTYRVYAFTIQSGGTPIELGTFVAGAKWSDHTVSLDVLSAADRREAVAILFGAGPAPGSFRFDLDQVELR